MVNQKTLPSIKTMKEVKLLQCFNEQELQEFIQLGQVVSFEEYSNIIIEGELTWGIYFILEGVIGVFKANKMSSNTYDVGNLKKGSFFGEMSLVDDGARSATVRALTQCHLFYISKDDFNNFISKSADRKTRFYENCVKVIVSRLRELDDNYVISQYQLWKTALAKQKEAA